MIRPLQYSKERNLAPKGVALVSVMALMAVIASLSVGLAWLGYQATARTQAQRDAGQAIELARALIDYGRWVLWADGRGAAGGSSIMDHLSEPWAQVIPHSRLDQLLGPQMNAQDRSRFAAAAISGQISDEQSRFNLALIQQEDGTFSSPGRAQLDRLFLFLGIPSGQSSALIDKLQSLGRRDSVREPLPHSLERSPWVRMQQILRSDVSLSEDQRRRILEHLTWLPGVQRLNINTVAPEVLRALAGDGQSELVDELIARRDRIPFRTPAEVAALTPPNSYFKVSLLDTQTSHFRMQGYAQFGLAEESFLVIVHRTGGKVSIIDRLKP